MPAGLIGLVLCSCVHLRFVEKQPRIQLHDHLDGSNEHDGDDAASLKEQAEAEDEGVPVEIDKWWLKVRIRKAALTCALAVLDAAACINLGWAASHGRNSRNDTFTIVEDACMAAFWVSWHRSGGVWQMMLTWIMIAILDDTRSPFSRCIHKTKSSTPLALRRPLIDPHIRMFRQHDPRAATDLHAQVASVSLWARILIPSSNVAIPSTLARATARPSTEEIVAFAFTVTIAALSTVAFLLASTIPRRPPYHFSSPYTYSVQSDLGGKLRPNVSQVIEASVLSILLFGWVTPVVRNGSTKDQLELDDLPHLDSSFRTVNLYRKFREATQKSVEKHRAKQQSSTAALEQPPRDGLGYAPRIFNRLLWRVLVVNKKAFIMNCSLAFVTAMLYYLPAFFLQKVVSYLEVANDGKQQQNRTLGFAYCFGLLLALVLDAITTSALWYISTVQLSSRIRVQLNAILFAKTLKVRLLESCTIRWLKIRISQRKDVMGSLGRGGDEAEEEGDIAAPGKNSKVAKAGKQPREDEETEDSDDENDKFSSKSAVLNLFSTDSDRVAECVHLTSLYCTR